MIVKNGNKTLWHVQNMNICYDDSAYNMFLWAEKEPTSEEIEKAFRKDCDNPDDEEVDELVEEMLTSSEIYKVYAEE